MKLTNSEIIAPVGDYVITEVLLEQFNETAEGLILEDSGDKRKSTDIPQVVIYKSKIISLGEESSKKFPELQKDNIVLMSQFAGYHVAVKSKFIKCVPVTDIMAIIDKLEITPESVHPSVERVVLEILPDGVDENNLVLDDKHDANEDQLLFGKIVQVGSAVPNFKNGDIVAIETYVGETIRSAKNNTVLELKICDYRNILFTLKQ